MDVTKFLRKMKTERSQEEANEITAKKDGSKDERIRGQKDRGRPHNWPHICWT